MKIDFDNEITTSQHKVVEKAKIERETKLQ